MQVGAQEREVRQRVKAAGGKWNPKAGVWELAYGQVTALGLTGRIVPAGEEQEQGSPLLIDGARHGQSSTNR